MLSFFMGFQFILPVKAEEDGSTIQTYEAVETATTEDESLATEETQSSDTTLSISRLIGQITEIEGTETPTTILIKKVSFSKDSAGKILASKGEEATINITSSTKLDFELSWWMAGDMIQVKGTQNSSTGLIDATEIKHLSHSGKNNHGYNGWIKEVNADGKYIQVEWNNKLTKINIIDGTTRIIVPGKGDVTLADLKVEDRVRVRGEKVSDTELNAKTLMVLRHGEKKFIKLRTKKMIVNFVGANSDGTFSVEGRKQSYTVKNTDKTVILYEKIKQTDLSKFASGDQIFLVGRLNDDGTLDARLIRDFKSLAEGGSVGGTITKVDVTNGTISIKAGRNEFRVDFTSTTPIMDESGATLTSADLSQGKRIRVEGTLVKAFTPEPGFIQTFTGKSINLVTATKITVVDAEKTMKRVKKTPMGK